MSAVAPPLAEDDPELEREFREWAQWLLDVYLAKLQQEYEANRTPDVDDPLPQPKM